MRMSKLFAPTLKEKPAEAEAVSHSLMLRAGLIRKVASGIYNWLPLGYRTLRKVEQIIREEMNRAGAQEIFMPVLSPAELWFESGRWHVYGPELMRIKDRHGRDFCLGPTHEEVVTTLVRDNHKTYRGLPLILYQIQTKFRDEPRPRYGVMRAREFGMKDAYSFDRDYEGLDKSYNAMYEAYCRIFERCGLEYRVIDADPGAIGGSGSQEFVIIADTGESLFVYCDSCDFAASTENAECKIETFWEGEPQELQKVHTPGVKTIEDLAKFLNIDKSKTIKSMVYEAIYPDKSWELVVALIRGDREINEVKLKNYLGALHLNLAKEEQIRDILKAEAGFVGPIELKGKDVKVIADKTVEGAINVVVGASEKDYHYINACWDRDFKADIVIDICVAEEGDVCPRCGAGKLSLTKGIEVGHIFKLGTKYSQAHNATFIDKDGKEKFYIMGCYGIGTGRTVAAAIEQNHDEYGICWPVSIAPYQCIIVVANYDDEKQKEIGERLYEELAQKGVEVVIDDRDERAGVKFNDADLIGFPYRITVGNNVENNVVEVMCRKTREVKEVSVDEASDYVANLIKKEMQRLNSCINK